MSPAFAVDVRGQAARLIAERAPGDLDVVFFTNGGAEANENAVRMARLHTGRHKVLAAYRSYHGATAGSIALTGEPRRWPSEPGMPGVVRYWGPYVYRSSFHARPKPRNASARSHICARSLMVEGAHTVAAIVLETVVGTNGILVPPDGYLAGVRAICDEHGHRDDRRRGDVGVRSLRRMVRGRPLGRDARPHHVREGRELRVRAVGRRDHLAADRRHVRPASRSPAASPTRVIRSRAASAVASIEIFEDEGIVEHARDDRGAHDRSEAAADSRRSIDSVGEVRGLGVFWALELVRNRATREPLVPFNASGDDAQPMAEVARRDEGSAACGRSALQPGALRPAVHRDRGGGRRGHRRLDAGSTSRTGTPRNRVVR